MAELGRIIYEVKIKHAWLLYITIGIPSLFGFKGFIPKWCISFKLSGDYTGP